MPRLDALYETYRERGLALVGVSLDRGREELEAMVRDRGLAWPQVWDGPGAGEGSLARTFHVEGPPVLWVLDGRGLIAAKRLDLDELKGLAARRLDARPFTLDDGLALRALVGRHPVDLSPDGELVAYCVESRDTDEDPGSRHYFSTGVHRMVQGSEVWLTEVATGATRRLTEGWGTSWGARWSPDGSRLAFYSDRTGRPLLWVWDRATGDVRPFEGAVVRTFFAFELPEWSPDGRFLYTRALAESVEGRFAAQPDHWPREEALAPETGADPGIGGATGSVAGGPAFLRIYDSRARREAPPEPGGGAVTRGRGVIDLVGIEVGTGRVVRVLEERALRDFDLSPDGRYLAVMNQLGPENVGAQQPLFELLVIPSAGGEPVARTTVREGYGIATSWSPASDRVAFATIGPLASGDVQVLDVETARVRNLTAGVEEDLAPTTEIYDPPVWTPDGESLLWTGDGDLWRIPVEGGEPRQLTEGSLVRIAGVVRPSEEPRAWQPEPGVVRVQTFDSETFEAGFARVDLETGELSSLVREARRYRRVVRLHVDVEDTAAGEPVVVWASESNVEPADLWVAGPSFAEPRRLTAINAHLEGVDLGEPRLLSWKAPDGSVENAILVLPRGTPEGEKLPMVVSVYAGSRPSRAFHSFGLSENPVAENPALLTGRGYAALYPDIPLEEGGDPLEDMVRPVLAAVDAALATGRIDPERLGLFGHSYGGYSVNALVTRTDRFAAAVASTGASNLASYFFQKYFFDGTTGWFETGQGAMGGPPWEHPERYVANSPVFHLDRVTTPLLLAHSAADDAYWQSVEMYAGLARLGREAVLLRYEDADHYFGAWSDEKLRDFWERVFAWYDEHLRADPAEGRVPPG